MSGRAAIIGIGETRLGRLPGKTAMQLQAEATRAAIADAGLGFEDIDAEIALVHGNGGIIGMHATMLPEVAEPNPSASASR